MGLLQDLKTKVLTADGAIGTLLYSYGLDYCHEEMNIARPEIIEKIHGEKQDPTMECGTRRKLLFVTKH